jgi:hypothetical protein
MYGKTKERGDRKMEESVRMDGKKDGRKRGLKDGRKRGRKDGRIGR